MSILYGDYLGGFSVQEYGEILFAHKRNVPKIAALGIYGIGNKAHIDFAIERIAAANGFQIRLQCLYRGVESFVRVYVVFLDDVLQSDGFVDAAALYVYGKL